MKRHAARKGQDAFQEVNEDESQDRQPVGNEQLIQQLKETADKLIRDQANRGDIKLLNTALKELRYAFKVFAPYRNQRKVTVFGSARLPPDHPAYHQAVLFSRKVAEAGFMVITGAASGIMEAGHDLALYKVTDSVEEAVAEVTGFYRVYHSMRYVKGDLVLRLQRPLTEPLLQRIREEFADILLAGTFEQTGALPAEANDPHLA